MIDDAVPSGMAGRWAEMERRIANLERAQRIRSSGIQGGALIVADANGVEIARVGQLPSGKDGLRVSGTAPGLNHLLVDEDGFTLPFHAHPWRLATLSPQSVSSTSFTSIWLLNPQLAEGPFLETTVFVSQPGGTTCEMRLYRPALAAAIGSPITLTATTQTVRWKGPHGVPVRTLALATIALQIRVASGAGPVTIHEPTEGAIGGELGSGDPLGWLVL
jgi:hypothetical protein